MLLRALVLVLAAAALAPAGAQDRRASEQRLAALRAQIRGAEQTVQRARADETQALQAVEGLAAEIRLREELVSGYRGVVDSVRTETAVLQRSIGRLENEIELNRQSVRERARHAYMHGRRNALALLLSAGSLNQMIVRARYLQQFAGQRRRQADRIAEQTGELRGREGLVRERLETTQRLLMQTTAEQQTLAQRRAEREGLAADLRTRRAGLERQLAQQRADASALERLVRELGTAERQRAEATRAEAARQQAARQQAAAAAQAEAGRAEAARVAEVQRRAQEAAARAREREVRARPEPRPAQPPAVQLPPISRPPVAAAPAAPPVAAQRPPAEPPAAAPPPAASRPPEPVAEARARPEPRAEASPRASAPAVTSGSFVAARGRLPWPADGTVTGRFGTRTDPAYNTQVQAIGIDIATAPGAPARAVFDGTVERVGQMATYGTFVMVSHGDFTTIYGNLSGVAVERGQRVTTGQAVGRAGTADARRGSQLFFALFQSGRPVDPAAWLSPR